MSCRRSWTTSSAACKIARTTCPTGRWRCVPHLQSIRELTLFGTLEHNGFFSRTIVAFLVRKFQPYSFCRRLDRAGPPCRTRTARLADGAGGARRGENPVPKHSGERGERPEATSAYSYLRDACFHVGYSSTRRFLYSPVSLFCTASGWS